MNQKEKTMSNRINWKFLLINVLGFLFIFFFLFILRLPLFINAENFLNFDEAYQGSQIIDLMNGGPIHFYYEGVSYAGIPLGLASIPLFWMFGISAFAYKVPATLAYALYILSSYWIAKRIYPPGALIAVILLLFSPLSALHISTNNWQHNLILFLGNFIFLLFLKIKESSEPNDTNILMLGIVTGFSIYSYTFSILYIATIAILFALTHESWSLFRAKISMLVFRSWWQGDKTRKMKLVRIIDVIIFCFLVAILFSYIFGGFGIDIGGFSIFQINNLHKPVIQVCAIIAVRLVIFRKDILNRLGNKNILDLLKKIFSIHLFFVGLAGFLLGILPRILSIFTGEVTRGGQGFDVDFNPIKLIVHLWDLITFYIPEFFDLRQPISSLIASKLSFWILLRASFAVVVGILLIISVGKIYISRKLEIKNLIQFKALKFSPDLVLLIFPILLCSAVVIIQNGTLIRYLLPLHGVVSIWLAMYLSKIRCVSNLRFFCMLIVWCGFFLMNTYSFYTGSLGGQSVSNKILNRDFSIVKLENRYKKLVNYFISKNAKYIYSDQMLSTQLNFLSQGKIIAGIYDQDRTIRRKNQILSSKKPFSIVISMRHNSHLKKYREFLVGKSIKFSQELVDEKFWVLSDFVGGADDINSLRHLIPIGS